MTDAEWLFLLIVGFYLAEATFWVRAGTFLFSCQLGGRRLRRIDQRWALLRNPHGGLLVGNLLPLGHAGVCQQWPLSLSPWGIYGYVCQCFSKDGRPEQPERFIRYEDIRSVTADGNDVLVNGKHFLRVGSTCFARRLAALVQELKLLPEAERGQTISAALTRHLNPVEVQSRLDLFQSASAELQITCCVLVFLVFMLPMMLIWLEASFPVFTFLSAYLALAWLGTIQFHFAHRLLHPEERLERWKQTLVMLVSPADVLHARDKLTRTCLIDCSPLSVAMVVCSRDQFDEFAAESWRDVEYPMLPICAATESGPQETEEWFRLQWREHLARFLEEAGLCATKLVEPPAPDSSEALTYCPRCLGQYLLPAGTCYECGGRPLQPLRN
jgi:hypothetical protein